MTSTLDYPFKSSGFSVQRNEIISVQPTIKTQVITGNGVSVSFDINCGSEYKINTDLADVEPIRAFKTSINGPEYMMDNFEGDSSFDKSGEVYFSPPANDTEDGKVTFESAPAEGQRIILQYFIIPRTGNIDPTGILQSLAKDLTLHPYRNDYSESWSSNKQKKSLAEIILDSNFADASGQVTVTDSAGTKVNFSSDDVGKRIREKYGRGIFKINSVTENVADVTVVTPKNDSSIDNYSIGEWIMVISENDVEPQPYNLIYPPKESSSESYPEINIDGQQNQTDVMESVRRIGSMFVVESEKGTDILSSLKDIDSSNTFIPTTALASQVAQENRTPQKWRIRFFYDTRDEFIHINVGTSFQILEDGNLSETVGRDGLQSGPTRTPGELSDVYYKFDQKGNKAKSGFYRRQGKTDSNIAGTYPISYRLTCSDHGTAFFIQDQASVDDDDYAWFVVQRHVNNISGKIDLEDGKSPVHCVYCPSKRPQESSDYNMGLYGSYSSISYPDGRTVIETTGVDSIYKTDGTKLNPELPIQFTITTDKDPVAIGESGTSFFRGSGYLNPPENYNSVHVINTSDDTNSPEYPIGSNYSGSRGQYNKIQRPDSGESTAGDMLGFPYGSSTSQSPTTIEEASDQEFEIVSYQNISELQPSNPENLKYYPKRLNTLSLSRQEQLGPSESGFSPFRVQIRDGVDGGSNSVASLKEDIDYRIYKETDDYWYFQFTTRANENKVPNAYAKDLIEGPNNMGATSSSTFTLSRHSWLDLSTGGVIVPRSVLLNGSVIPSSHYEISQKVTSKVVIIPDTGTTPLDSSETKTIKYTTGETDSDGNLIETQVDISIVVSSEETYFEIEETLKEGISSDFPVGRSVDVDMGEDSDLAYKVSSTTISMTENPTFKYVRGDDVALANSDMLEIRSYYSPEKSKVVLSYVWNGAGYGGKYANPYGANSSVKSSEETRPLYEVNRLDVFVNGVEINSSQYPSGHSFRSDGTIKFKDSGMSQQNSYVYSIAQDNIYLRNELRNGERLKFSYENYNSTEETDTSGNTFLFKVPEDRDIPSAWTNLHKDTVAIHRFVVRESDVLKPWDFHASAIIPQIDSPAIINPQEQLSITQDKTFVFTFPSPLTTQKFIYPNSEIDMICYSSASSSTLGGFTSIGTDASPKYDLDRKQLSLATDLSANYILPEIGTAPSGSSSSDYTSSNGDVLNYRDIYDWHTGQDSVTTSASRTYVGMQSTQSYGNGMRIFVLVRGGPINPIYSDFIVRS